MNTRIAPSAWFASALSVSVLYFSHILLCRCVSLPSYFNLPCYYLLIVVFPSTHSALFIFFFDIYKVFLDQSIGVVLVLFLIVSLRAKLKGPAKNC